MKKEDMNIVVVGHVDHGKSTLIGRLLADTNSLPKGKLEAIENSCRKNAKPFEYAFLLDALKDEQSQGITIDIARCFFKTSTRNYIILDAPGHVEFLKNMVTGATKADAAILVIDAKEGIKENSKRHGYMLSMLGIKQVVVAINKMDLINYSEKDFNNIKNEYLDFLGKINVTPMDVIPISAFNGENIVNKSEKMKWYSGKSILDVLESFKSSSEKNDLSFRMPVQDVYKFTSNGDNRRIIVGTIETGKITTNTTVKFFPSEKESKIKTIETFPENKKKIAYAKEAVGFTLEEQLYIKRGELMTIKGEKEPIVSNIIGGNVFWLGKHPLMKNAKYLIKIGTEKVKAELINIINVLDSANLIMKKQEYVNCNDVAKCVFRLEKKVAYDIADNINEMGRFVIVDDYEISGGGIITDYNIEKSSEDNINSNNIIWQNLDVTYEDRCNVLKQNGKVIWFTGLSGAGKSTIANNIEKYLNRNGYATYLLDGDNIRHGINNDLGFSKEDRIENIRRIIEIAKLFQDAGIIVLVSFITPFEEMREKAKEIIGKDNIIEVYVKASLETCVQRDPKGLYKKKIENFTGISSPYDIPKNPNIIIDTDNMNINDSCEKLVEYIKKEGVIKKL